MLQKRGDHGARELTRVSSPPGYSLYYLWAMPGDQRQLALYEDPAHRWIHDHDAGSAPR
jgi:5-deoxy-D-glucuronate isomerase